MHAIVDVAAASMFDRGRLEGGREGEYGGGERWSEHPCLISWPLCPRDTSHLKFKRVPSGRIKTEARWLN